VLLLRQHFCVVYNTTRRGETAKPFKLLMRQAYTHTDTAKVNEELCVYCDTSDHAK